MHSNPIVTIFVITMLSIVIMAVIMKKFRQPYIVAYLIVGIILGPYGISAITDQKTLSSLGEIGVILLLFFIGMEIDPRKLIKNLTVPIFATIIQVVVSILIVFAVSFYTHWSFRGVILIGFIISLSSTAVILKLLQDWNEMESKVGQNIIGILIVQDLAIVPMMIILGFLGGGNVSIWQITLQILGGVLVIAFFILVITKDELNLPFIKKFVNDKEMETFIAITICFGLSAITAFLGLSLALGSFLAGILISSAKETKWVHEALSPLKIIFIGLFFISIGMLIDIHFILEHIFTITFFLFLVYSLNTVINAMALIMLKQNWKTAIYGSSILSQAGEFGFVLVGVGLSLGILDDSGYKYCVSVIALSLLFSPIWISINKNISLKFLRHKVKKRLCL